MWKSIKKSVKNTLTLVGEFLWTIHGSIRRLHGFLVRVRLGNLGRTGSLSRYRVDLFAWTSLWSVGLWITFRSSPKQFRRNLLIRIRCKRIPWDGHPTYYTGLWHDSYCRSHGNGPRALPPLHHSPHCRRKSNDHRSLSSLQSTMVWLLCPSETQASSAYWLQTAFASVFRPPLPSLSHELWSLPVRGRWFGELIHPVEQINKKII